MGKSNINRFCLIGLRLRHKTTNEGGQSGIDCGGLWQKFIQGGFAERIPDVLSNEIYAVYFDYEGDHTKPFAYFIGCKVSADTKAPHDMDSLMIPSDRYTKVIASGQMPDCVANAWKEIWSSSINRKYNYDFEVYDERSKDWSNAEIDLYISTN